MLGDLLTPKIVSARRAEAAQTAIIHPSRRVHGCVPS